MLTIELQAIPNQKFNFLGDGQQYTIALRTVQDMTFMDVAMNGSTLITSCKCLPGQMVIPYDYLEGEGGNFFFQTASGNNPQYANFGGADVLLYASNAELAAVRGA